MKKLLRDLLVVLPAFALIACGGEDPKPAGNCGDFTVEGDEQCDMGPAGGDGEGFGCTVECTIIPPSNEVCDDGDDNDFDGDEDCEDSDCDGVEACLPPAEICDDGIDNDFDEAIDCEDTDCAADAVACPVASDEVCEDGIDNDLDGDTDCDDDDCDISGVCPEICDDEFDNDSDGALDCLDADCAGNRACPAACGDGRIDQGEECDDGLANGSEPDSCRENCAAPRCGDGITDTGEACDTGAEVGAPGECWQGCTLAPEADCGSATVVDANEVAATNPRGFNFNAFGDYTENLSDSLTPPESCSNGAADGEDLVLYWVPEVTGWYELNADFGQFEEDGDIIFWVMDGQCGGNVVACGEDSASNRFGTALVAAEAGSPLVIAIDLKGEFSSLRLEASRVDEFVSAGESCNPIAGDVCEPGSECNDSLLIPLCQLPLGSCQNPEDISEEFLFSFDGSAEVTRNTGRQDNLSGGTCGGSVGPEYVTSYTNGNSIPVALGATAVSPGSTVYVNRECGAQSSELLCTGNAQASTRIEAGETVYVTLDSVANLGGFETFRLTETPIVGVGVTCDLAEVPTVICDNALICDEGSARCEPDDGLTCAAPFDANQFGDFTTGVLEFTLAAANATRVIPNACSSLGADLVARYVPEITGTAVIELSGSGTFGLAAQPVCSTAAGVCLAPDADESTLFAPIVAGEPIFIIADPEGTTGTATITVTEATPLELGDDCVPDGGGILCEFGLACATDDGGSSCRAGDAGSCGLEDPFAFELRDSLSFPVGDGLVEYVHECGTSSEVFEVVATEDGVLVVTIEDDAGRRDAGLAIRSECGEPETEIACEFDAAQVFTRLDLEIAAGESGFFHAVNVTTGTMSIVLVPVVGLGEVCDADGLAAQCGEGRCLEGRCAAGLFASCEAPDSLLNGFGDAYSGGVAYDVDTIRGTSRSIGGCGGVGAEYVTSFTAPTAGQLIVQWETPGEVAVLYARRECDSTGTQLDCESAASVGASTSLALDLADGERAFLVFDSNAAAGVGVLGTANVEFVPLVAGSCATNGILDADETGLDCGGPFCGPCPVGANCTYGGDCEAGTCLDNECSTAAHCANDELDADETDVDCGGADCAGCFVGDACLTNDDCSSRLCDDSGCEFSTCDDGRVGGQESDIDCGGPFCELCDTGESCFDSSDCVSGFCDSSVCARP